MAKSSTKQQAAHNFDALFGARQGERIVSGGFKMLAHDRITLRPQVRRTFPRSEMDELRGSIRELRTRQGGIEGTGVLQALLVCPEGDGYRLIAGEKRFRATQAEGLREVPCVVVPAVSEGMVRLLQLTENAQRTAPPVLEEAQALRETMNEQKLSLRETMNEQKLSLRDLARLLGKTLGYITNRLSLLKMAPEVQEMVACRSDTLKHAPLIAAIEDHEQRAALIRAVVEEELSVKGLERRLRPNAPGISEPESTGQTNSNVEVFSRENSHSSENREIGKKDARNGTPNLSNERSENERSEQQNQHKSDEAASPDPFFTALKPARSVLAEVERLLAGRSLSPDDQAALVRHVAAVEKHLARLKTAIG